MKKLVFALLFVSLFVPVVKSEEVKGTYWEISGFSFVYPLANVDASFYWKSVTTGDELFGVQTTLVSYPKKSITLYDDMVLVKSITIPANLFTLGFGGITSLKANGMPYFSISVKLWNITNLKGEELLIIGTGYGRDFKLHQDHFILGATKKVW